MTAIVDGQDTHGVDQVTTGEADGTGSDRRAPDRSGRSRRWGILRELRRRPVALVAVVVLVLLVLIAVLAPLLVPFDPNRSDFSRVASPPRWPNVLGTDTLGRDVLSRLMYGARTSLFASLQAVVVSTGLGATFGIASGYLGGKVDAVLDRVNGALMSVPPLILAVAMVAALGTGLTKAMIAIGLVYSTRIFRVSRAAAIEIRSLTYMDAARVIGAGRARIAFRHVLPNALSPILVLVVLTFAAAVVSEAGLTYIGLGAQPPTASWGSMLYEASTRMDLTHLLYAPGITLLVTVSALIVTGDFLRDVLASNGGARDA